MILTIALLDPEATRKSRRFLLVCKLWFRVGGPILRAEVHDFCNLARLIGPVDAYDDPEVYEHRRVQCYVRTEPVQSMIQC